MSETKKPIWGKDKVLKFRLLDDAGTKKAAKLALQISHSIKYDASVEGKKTKDGQINYSKGMTTTIDMTALSTRDEVNTLLSESVKKQKVLEVWEIDLGAEPQGGKYPARYGRGLLTTWEEPADVESAAEFSTTMNIDGELQDGMVEVTNDELIEVQYAFQDTDATV